MGVTRCLSHPRTQIHLDLKMNCVVSQSILGSCRSYWVLETVLSENVTQWFWAGQCTGKCLSELDPIWDRREIPVHKYLFMASLASCYYFIQDRCKTTEEMASTGALTTSSVKKKKCAGVREKTLNVNILSLISNVIIIWNTPLSGICT